jgi:hypothetical protein
MQTNVGNTNWINADNNLRGAIGVIWIKVQISICVEGLYPIYGQAELQYLVFSA